MSSRELLALLADTPADSAFRERGERGMQLVELPDGDLRLYSILAPVPDGGRVEATFIDWPADRKIAARVAAEVALSRADGRGYEPNLDGLREPLFVALQARRDRELRANRDRVTALVHNAIERGKRGE